MFIFIGKSKTHKSQGSSEDYSLDLTGPPSDPYARLRHQPLVLLGVLKSLGIRVQQNEVTSQGMHP